MRGWVLLGAVGAFVLWRARRVESPQESADVRRLPASGYTLTPTRASLAPRVEVADVSTVPQMREHLRTAASLPPYPVRIAP